MKNGELHFDIKKKSRTNLKKKPRAKKPAAKKRTPVTA
jgi:hypothetical protein